MAGAVDSREYCMTLPKRHRNNELNSDVVMIGSQQMYHQ